MKKNKLPSFINIFIFCLGGGGGRWAGEFVWFKPWLQIACEYRSLHCLSNWISHLGLTFSRKIEYIDKEQVVLYSINLMAYKSQRVEEALSLHNGSTMRKLSTIKSGELKPIN